MGILCKSNRKSLGANPLLTPLLHLFAQYGILWFCALVIIIPSMIVVYLHVRKQESIAAKWQKKSGQQESYANSRKVMQQGLFFSTAFIITWIFPTLTRLMQAITGKAPFALILLMTIFLPMQGLINAMVFLRPKYVKFRKDNPDRSLWYILTHTVFSAGRNKSYNYSGSVVITMFNRSSAAKSGISRFSSAGGGDEAEGNGEENEKTEDKPESKRRHSSRSVQFADERCEDAVSAITSSSMMVGDIEEMKVDEEEKVEEG
jgi:hypothetical protein